MHHPWHEPLGPGFRYVVGLDWKSSNAFPAILTNKLARLLCVDPVQRLFGSRVGAHTREFVNTSISGGRPTDSRMRCEFPTGSHFRYGTLSWALPSNGVEQVGDVRVQAVDVSTL